MIVSFGYVKITVDKFILSIPWGTHMNRNLAIVGFVLIAVAIGMGSTQNADAFLHKTISGLVSQVADGTLFGGYEKTLIVEYVEVQPAIETASYFFVYGIDPLTGEERIVELQNNSLSTLFNMGKTTEGLLNLDILKYTVMKNVGNTITFECNGADNWGVWMEQYPQCFRTVSIEGEEHLPVSSLAELEILQIAQSLGQ